MAAASNCGGCAEQTPSAKIANTSFIVNIDAHPLRNVQYPATLDPMRLAPALCLLLSISCAHHPDVRDEVGAFARTVAEDVTHQGVTAWRTYFPESPNFFMAVDGHLEFQNGADAHAKIPVIARAIKSIQLAWGDPIRIDVLTPELAAFAAPWHEVIKLADGNRTDASGYFTAVVEKRGGRWQFRNAHWSTVPVK